MRSCLPISTISISFVGFESRSTMFPASFAAWVPVFMATPTSACARAGASFVPSPVIATSRPAACSRRINAILSSGVASARNSSTPDSSAIAGAVRGLSPVIITVRMPIRRISSNRSRMPSLTTSFRWTTPHGATVSRRRRAAFPRRPDLADGRLHLGGSEAPSRASQAPIASAAPLRTRRPATSMPLIRVWAEKGTSVGALEVALAQPEPLLGEDDDRASLRRLVGEAESCAASASCSASRPARGSARSPGGSRA